MSLHTTRFPNESKEYRDARDKLLQAEIELRRNVEKVAALRRTMPLGGEIPEDYVFDEGGRNLDDTKTVKQTRLSQLFEPGKDSLIVYSFMYGPKMEKPCPSCSSILDSMNGAVPHVTQRTNLAVVAKSPIERIRSFAREHGWGNLRLLSSANNTYNRDYRGENAEGNQTPSLNVFTRKDGKIYHFFCTELMFVPGEEGQDPRHVDMIWPLWNLLDYTPEGRGQEWRPKLSYGKAA
jgi:predicted dithiol-disulfide oxidoreductase (DUF899 family)